MPQTQPKSSPSFPSHDTNIRLRVHVSIPTVSILSLSHLQILTMKFAVVFSILAAAASAVPVSPVAEVEKRNCNGVDSVAEDGSVVKRCAIPWTKNYGDYE